MNIESLIDSLEMIDIKEDTPCFLLNNDIIANELYFVTKVKLNFYQVWSLFNKLPNVYEYGKCKYEWKFTSKNNDYVFVICDWNNDKSLLQTNTWNILSNTLDDDIISKFLKNLCDALECYNEYYKESIESHTFTSENPIINTCLQEIKKTLVENKDILKRL